MRFYKILQLLILLMFFTFSCTDQNFQSEADSDLIVTFEDSLSYSMGINVAKNLPKTNINEKLFLEGVQDFWDQNTPKLDANARSEILRAFNIMNAVNEREQLIKMTERQKELSRENKMKGQEFLEKNKLSEGVIVLKRSGIQYRVIKQGNGDRPDYDVSVTVHYNGYLVDGHKFDSSYDKGEPITLKIAQFIPGWQEILQIMTVGSKWEVVIPQHLAYGAAGIAANREKGEFVIPPSSTLIFEMELLGIVN